MLSHRSFQVALLLLGLLASPLAADDKKKDPSADEALKARLKPHEEKVAEIRKAMLKECDDELKKLDETIKKAQKDMANAKGDRDAQRKGFAVVTRAQHERMRVTSIRALVDRRLHLAEGPPRPPPSEEQKLGIATSIPGTVLVKQLGLKKDQGVVLERVEPNSPAAKAGLQQYDVLVQIDGKPAPSNLFALRKVIAALEPGKPVEAVVVRQGKQETLKGLTMPGGEEPKTPPMKSEGK